MADYISQYTGGQIDSAVGRALPGGALEELIAEKAPGGFGFGDSIDLVATWQNTEAELEANLDALAATMQNRTAKNIAFACSGTLYNLGNFYGIFYVRNKADKWYGIRAVDPTNGLAVQKVCQAGVWSPFEFENPPMQLGVEYRTTERYLGKPVYAFAMDFGDLPNTTIKQVAHNRGTTVRPFAFGGSCDNGNVLPYTQSTGNSSYAMTLGVDNVNFYLETFRDRSSLTATVWMKYTKTTD